MATVIEAILRKAQIADLELPDRLPDETKVDESLRFHFERLVVAAQALGYTSVYVLVDKIDEIDITSTDASAAYEFIRPLVNDLPTLDAVGVAFKFFLWDRIEDDYRSGRRPPRSDRNPQLEMERGRA